MPTTAGEPGPPDAAASQVTGASAAAMYCLIELPWRRIQPLADQQPGVRHRGDGRNRRRS